MNINTKSTFLHTFMAPLGAKVLLTTALLSIATAAFAGEKVDKTIDTSSSPKVDIEHINGKADIRVWDKSQVRVTGELGDQIPEPKIGVIGQIGRPDRQGDNTRHGKGAESDGGPV